MTKLKGKRQEDTIKKEICKMILEDGETDISKIYSTIRLRHGIPQPTIRKFAREHRLEMLKQVEVLSSNIKHQVANSHE